VRERYPTFVDALRDLDDALCMVHLFATLPGDEGQAIPAERVQMSRRIVLEWQAFCCRTAAMRKAFISVKGFYLQVHPPHLNCLRTPQTERNKHGRPA
jgi:pescadillo